MAIGFGDEKLEELKPLVGVAKGAATGDVRAAAAGVYEEGALLPPAAAPPHARPWSAASTEWKSRSPLQDDRLTQQTIG